jgi:hypothetical protein
MDKDGSGDSTFRGKRMTLVGYDMSLLNEVGDDGSMYEFTGDDLDDDACSYDGNMTDMESMSGDDKRLVISDVDNMRASDDSILSIWLEPSCQSWGEIPSFLRGIGAAVWGNLDFSKPLALGPALPRCPAGGVDGKGRSERPFDGSSDAATDRLKG